MFPEGRFSQPRLDAVLAALGGDKSKLIIDLSCRRQQGDGQEAKWFVAMNKWQTITDMEVNQGTGCPDSPPSTGIHIHYAFSYMIVFDPRTLLTVLLSDSIRQLEPYCSEFLIHAADNEGLQRGVDEKLITKLSQWCSIPVTYAGGGRNLEDLEKVKNLSQGKVDLTIGSALDCFGGSGVRLEECVEWNRRQQKSS